MNSDTTNSHNIIEDFSYNTISDLAQNDEPDIQQIPENGDKNDCFDITQTDVLKKCMLDVLEEMKTKQKTSVYQTNPYFLNKMESVIMQRNTSNIKKLFELQAEEKMAQAMQYYNKNNSEILIGDVYNSQEDSENNGEPNKKDHALQNGHIINIEPKSNIIKRPITKEKMPTCGTWGDDCCNCLNVFMCMVRCCCYCGYCGECIMTYVFIPIKKIYFFALYLLTGELNNSAIEYKKYFSIRSIKDDEVNKTEIVITAISVAFELYKTLIGSFLIVFSSQRCGTKTCTIWENIVPRDNLELTGIICNFLMATVLLIEYFFEILREAYLIKYLHYDKNLANNGKHISDLYGNANKKIFTKLIPLYVIYIRFSYVVCFVYFINVILSAIIVGKNYYDNTSVFSFITNALFIFYKIYRVVEITSFKGNYFYSAYKKKNIHYNSIKPKYIKYNTENWETGIDNIEEHENENIGIDVVSEDSENNYDEFFNTTTSNKTPIICDGNDLIEEEKNNVLLELYEKNYIDKRAYYKIRLFSHYGE